MNSRISIALFGAFSAVMAGWQIALYYPPAEYSVAGWLTFSVFSVACLVIAVK